VVDRPQVRRGGNDHRQRKLAREVADQVAGREGDHQPPDPLAYEDVGVTLSSPCRPEQPRRLDSVPGQLRGQVWGGGGVVAVGRDLLI
jgi:hypothetical protein